MLTLYSAQAIIVPHRIIWSWYTGRGLLHLVQRGATPQPAQAPTRCTKCNSPPINGKCTNHRTAYNGPLLCGFKGLKESKLRVLASRHKRCCRVKDEQPQRRATFCRPRVKRGKQWIELEWLWNVVVWLSNWPAQSTDKERRPQQLNCGHLAVSPVAVASISVAAPAYRRSVAQALQLRLAGHVFRKLQARASSSGVSDPSSATTATPSTPI